MRNLNTRTLLDEDVTVGAALRSVMEELAPVSATPRLDVELLLMAVWDWTVCSSSRIPRLS